MTTLTTVTVIADDPDAYIERSVTSRSGSALTFDPLVAADDGDYTIAGTWQGSPAPTRVLRVPVADLALGHHHLWLRVPSENDIDLGWVTVAPRQPGSGGTIPPASATKLLNLVQGYVDHGNVSGALTIDPAIGTHVLDATATTTLTLGAADNGVLVSVLVTTGAASVSVSGLPDAELTNGSFATFARIRGAWVLGAASAGGSTPAPDTTPPSAVTDLSASGGEGQIVLNWSDATDAENAVSYRYRVWLTSGGASGTWTTTTTSAATITGLSAGAYTAEVYAYSAGGASATDTATATVTAPAGWSEWDRHEFTAADGTLVSTLPTAQGRSYANSANAVINGNACAANWYAGGAANSTSTLYLSPPTASRMRHSITYDNSNASIGYKCYIDASLNLTQTGQVGLWLEANSNSSPTASNISYVYATSAGVSEPPVIYESGKSANGHPVTGVLTLVANADAARVDILINDVLIGHIDTSTFSYGGNPNPVATSRAGFEAGNRSKIDRHVIEVYS